MRSRLEQYMDILGAMEGKNNGTGITKLMYASNICSNVVKKNLEVAIKMGHVKDDKTGSRRKFTLSDKGTGMYSGWKVYEQFSKELEEKLG